VPRSARKKIGTLILGGSQLGLQIHDPLAIPSSGSRPRSGSQFRRHEFSDPRSVEQAEIRVEHRERGPPMPASIMARDSAPSAYDDEGVLRSAPT